MLSYFLNTVKLKKEARSSDLELTETYIGKQRVKGDWFIGSRFFIQTVEAEFQRPFGDEGIAHPTKAET